MLKRETKAKGVKPPAVKIKDLINIGVWHSVDTTSSRQKMLIGFFWRLRTVVAVR